MFRRFGSQVTIVQRGREVLAREDADVAATEGREGSLGADSQRTIPRVSPVSALLRARDRDRLLAAGPLAGVGGTCLAALGRRSLASGDPP